MSLVAYGSSDDSDNDTDQEDDSQEIQRTVQINSSAPKEVQSNRDQTPSSTKNSSVLDEDNYEGENDFSDSRPSLFNNIPLPKPIPQKTFDREAEEDEVEAVDNLKSRFPVPSSTDEVEVGLHRSSLRTKFALNLPAPKAGTTSVPTMAMPRKKEGKSVKISVPAISTFDSDEEEEETPAKKKIKQSSGLSGLFAVLPPPKNSVNKVMNRSLVPHTLTKKQTGAQPQRKEPLPVPSKFKPNDSEDEDGDLEEDGAVNFFSLNEKPNVTSADSEAVTASSTIEADKSVPADVRDRSWLPIPAVDLKPDSEAVVTSESPEDSEGSSAYNYPEQTVENEMSDAYNGLNSDGLPLALPQSALRELYGKKRGRPQEDLNIIDVSQEDQLPKSEDWLTKGLTEERASYSHRKKTHMPTSQQRRKHQITYLAFQAKERELELKNQWAQNRLTKRQTQSKYGF